MIMTTTRSTGLAHDIPSPPSRG